MIDFVKKYPKSVVWLDLEIDPDTDLLIIGAVVIENYYWCFDNAILQDKAQKLFELFEVARFLSGHNVFEFDLPRLVGFLSQTNIDFDINTILASWQAKTWDTLLLSCLLAPHQPTHALAKLYKEYTNDNNPAYDCVESQEIFSICQLAWQILSYDIQILYHRLLPALHQLSTPEYFGINCDYIFDFENILKEFPEGNQQALLNLIKQSCQALKTEEKLPITEQW